VGLQDETLACMVDSERGRGNGLYRSPFDDRLLPSLVSLSGFVLTLPASQPRKDQVGLMELLPKEAYPLVLAVAGLPSHNTGAIPLVLLKLPGVDCGPDMEFPDWIFGTVLPPAKV
jgi:hypothetical protein